MTHRVVIALSVFIQLGDNLRDIRAIILRQFRIDLFCQFLYNYSVLQRIIENF